MTETIEATSPDAPKLETQNGVPAKEIPIESSPDESRGGSAELDSDVKTSNAISFETSSSLQENHENVIIENDDQVLAHVQVENENENVLADDRRDNATEVVDVVAPQTFSNEQEIDDEDESEEPLDSSQPIEDDDDDDDDDDDEEFNKIYIFYKITFSISRNNRKTIEYESFLAQI